ncbi:unnamed protein product [Acanthosepion pharaonis]|uniref:Complex 1 LYR protein domain-containing protein n=1 Tax=Acanthosepion pharaonis TaxID=158019 RepID=A0A812ETQ2_ACAPH|nr:unnamed protein product [Sepia pharaonis]
MFIFFLYLFFIAFSFFYSGENDNIVHRQTTCVRWRIFFCQVRNFSFGEYLRMVQISMWKYLLLTWEAMSGKREDTLTERAYIASEASKLFRQNKNIKNASEIEEHIKEGEVRLELALHYRIPYPRQAVNHVILVRKGRLSSIINLFFLTVVLRQLFFGSLSQFLFLSQYPGFPGTNYNGDDCSTVEFVLDIIWNVFSVHDPFSSVL